MTNRYTKDKLYDLLPAIYRQRDSEGGDKVLESLISVIAKQVGYLEDDIERLYSNWFIETCDEWAVPYIADLLDVKLLNSVTKATFSQRSWVANTLSYRRRKGTVSVLEQLARDATGWNARAVEFFQLLVTTQYLNHLRLSNLSTVDLRDGKRLDALDTPFDKIAHTLDVRNININSNSNRGCYNIPNIGIFLWRLQSFPVYSAPSFNHGEGKFTFNQLGYDAPLFNHPKTETDITHLAEEINIECPITRRALYNDGAIDYYYSNEKDGDKSIKIHVGGEPEPKSIDKILVCDLTDWQHRPTDPDKIAVDPILGRILFPIGIEPKKVYVDYYYGFSGEIGGGFYQRTSYNSANMLKDSELQRELYISDKKVYSVSKKGSTNTIKDAIMQWKESDKKINTIIEITDSDVYEENLDEIKIPSGITLEIRSYQKQRPIIKLVSPLKISGEKGSNLIIDGLVLDFVNPDTSNVGNNSIINIEKGDLSHLIINQCTLVPERHFSTISNVKRDIGIDVVGESEIMVEENLDAVFLFNWENILTNEIGKNRLKSFLSSSFDQAWIDDSSILEKGDEDKAIFVNSVDGKHSISISLDDRNSKAVIFIDGITVTNYELIVKEKIEEGAGGGGGGGTTAKLLDVFANKISLQMNSKSGNDDLQIFIDHTIMGRIRLLNSQTILKVMDSIVDGPGSLNAIACYKSVIENSTIFGKLNVTILELASNSIFTDNIFTSRRQIGCARFCYIPQGSQTPRQYRCQPSHHAETSEVPKKTDIADIYPEFTSTHYGNPGYAQLHKNISKRIFEGADNESEMGAFNHLFQPQRINNMKTILSNEYLRFGLEAGIFLVT